MNNHILAHIRRRRRQRAMTIAAMSGLVAIALFFILSALESEISFFQSPGDLAEAGIADGRLLRVGGIVSPGSLIYGESGHVTFRIGDGISEITVEYRGLLPDLFMEEQGVVTEGRLDASGHLIASIVMAKHDENYMPREVAEALKKSGRWRNK